MRDNTLFSATDYDALAAIVFRADYPGYRPNVLEAPNGDAAARDAGKRYAHVAWKYLDQLPGDNAERRELAKYMWRAWKRADAVARELGVRFRFWPSFQHSALRVLQYAPGVGGHLHTDISLFTLNLYRSVSNPGLGGAEYHIGRLGELLGLGPAEPHRVDPLPVAQHSVVFFTIPDHNAALPGNQGTVGAWIAEQMKTMRYAK